MTLDELYVINLAIDERPIISVPELTGKNMSLLVIDSIKESMIEKGFLEDTNALTPYGTKIAKRVLDYKNAEKYIKVGIVSIGILDSNTGISLIRYPGGDVEFFRTDVSVFVDSLIEAYPFISEKPGISEKGSISCTYNEILGKYNINAKNSVFISSLKASQNEQKVYLTDDVFFYDTGQHFYYNRNCRELYRVIPDNIVELLSERLCS